MFYYKVTGNTWAPYFIRIQIKHTLAFYMPKTAANTTHIHIYLHELKSDFPVSLVKITKLRHVAKEAQLYLSS